MESQASAADVAPASHPAPLADVPGTPHRVAIHEDAAVVRLGCERLDLVTAPGVRGLLAELVRGGNQRLVLDLSDVAFLDSAGLGALVATLKRLRCSRERRAAERPEPSRRPPIRGDLRLCGVQPVVRSLLEIIRLDRVFSTHETVDEALQSFRPRS
jgi:anti-sigma B factor antagonist